jgi:IS605 OrfB family transposase
MNVKEAMKEKPQLIVVEKLNNVNHKTKFKRRLSKNMRRSLDIWNYLYWLSRLQMATEENCVSFRGVPAYYTSQMCPKRGHTERTNRKREVFGCLVCGYSQNADIKCCHQYTSTIYSGTLRCFVQT